MRAPSLTRSLLFAFLLTACLPSSGAAAPFRPWSAQRSAPLALQWQREVVDDQPSVGAFASAALDVEDHLYISYFDDASNSLKVAHHDGLIWQIEQLDFRNAVACQTSLRLDAAGRPLTSYCGTDPATGARQLKIAQYDGSEWQISVVSNEAASHTSLALDGAGQPHISYQVPGALQYASRDGSSWSFDTIDSGTDLGAYASLALDGNDRPHVSYYDASHGQLKYAVLDGSEWQIEPVDSGRSVGQHGSLALGPGSLPRISYRGGGELRYAWRDASTWHSEPVDTSMGAGLYTSLALDPAGLPRISYFQESPAVPGDIGQLEYAYIAGSAWVVEVVDTGGDLGSYSALALDTAGYPHIAYYNATDGHLEHAEYDQTPPKITGGPTVDPVTQTSAQVSWQTDEGSDSLVRYGKRAGVWNLSAMNPDLVQSHSLALTGLEPSTTYQYIVVSADASGNSVTSREGFFTTQPEDDGQAPEVPDLSLDPPAGPFQYLTLSAPATDNIGVERVEFYMDDKQVGTAYSPSPGGAYQFLLPPPHLGLAREEFYSNHNFGAVAYDAFGSSGGSSLDALPLTPPINGQLRILSPNPHHTLYAPGGTTPPGEELVIEVYASEYEWDCVNLPMLLPGDAFTGNRAASQDTLPTNQMPLSQWPPWCHEVERAVEWVKFYIDDALQATSMPDSNTDLLHQYTWNAGGLGQGSHEIKVVSRLSDGSEGQIFRYIHIVHADPSLDVNREMVRIDNYFQVRWLVENRGTAAAEVQRIVDNLSGFQAIEKTFDAIGATDDYYTVATSYVTSTRRCDVTLGLHQNTGGPLSLEPGESVILQALAVPILYANPWSGQYMAGDEPVQVRYQDATGWVDLQLDRPTTHTFNYSPLDSEVYAARAVSDYLIVSNPSRLFLQNQLSPGSANHLLSTMAELAQVKSGILGDATFAGPVIGPGAVARTYGAEYIRLLLDEWGLGMKGSDGILEHHPQNGYVLLVGEHDIIPARDLSKDNWLVHFSDLWYGDTNHDWPNPERVVGRILGNSAAQLVIPLQASINVHKGEPGFDFDRDRALVVAGRGDGRPLFELNAWLVAQILQDEFNSVQLVFQKQLEDAGNNMNERFREFALDQDVIYYRDHSSTSSWGDGSTVVDSGDLIGADPIDFGDSRPFVFGCACLSGSYDGTLLAESFLQGGAAVYIGATEVSDRLWNNKACTRLYTKWVGNPISIGQALRNTKRDITEGDWWSNYEGDRWAAEYNFYGDPKYGAAPGSTRTLPAAEIPSDEPPAVLSVVVPDYQVTTIGDEDHLEIPGGNILFELGKPLVPVYAVETTIPAGYRVQNVNLVSRSGLVTGTGLNLPIAALVWDSVGLSAAETDTEAGWWPEETYDWEIQENVDGSSMLLVRLSPFFYDPATTDFKFYQNYEFQIEWTPSTVSIELLTTDRDVYAQGDQVLVDLWLNNKGEVEDVLVETVIKLGKNDQVVDGLPLRTLKNLSGTATYFDRWDSSDHGPGDYYVESTVRDASGRILDRDRAAFTVGVTLGEVTDLAVSPSFFDPGDPVTISLDFENVGTVPISGTIRIQIQGPDGEIAEEFSHPVEDLAASTSVHLEKLWDTTGLPGGRYLITGQGLYASKATEPRVAEARARALLYLPCIQRNAP